MNEGKPTKVDPTQLQKPPSSAVKSGLNRDVSKGRLGVVKKQTSMAVQETPNKVPKPVLQSRNNHRVNHSALGVPQSREEKKRSTSKNGSNNSGEKISNPYINKIVKSKIASRMASPKIRSAHKSPRPDLKSQAIA